MINARASFVPSADPQIRYKRSMRDSVRDDDTGAHPSQSHVWPSAAPGVGRWEKRRLWQAAAGRLRRDAREPGSRRAGVRPSSSVRPAATQSAHRPEPRTTRSVHLHSRVDCPHKLPRRVEPDRTRDEEEHQGRNPHVPEVDHRRHGVCDFELCVEVHD